MKKLLSVLCLVLALLLVAACGAPAATPAPDAPAPDTSTAPEAPAASDVKVGVSIYTLKYEFFQGMEQGIKDQCAKLGYTLLPTHDELEDPVEMVNGAKALIDKGIDVLIISPFKPDAMPSIVDYAHQNGTKVIICDIGTGGSNYDGFVVSDCAGGGAMAADAAMAALKDSASKNVAVIKCEKTAVYANRRGDGFQAQIEANGFKVVNTQTGDSQQELGYSKMKDIMTANPDIVAVFCENDPMAVGAAQAIKEAGKKILVFGFNADGIALDAIKAGDMVGTVAQFPAKMGAAAVDTAKAYIEGGTPKFDNASSKEIFAPVKLVSADNVDTFND